MLALFVVCSDNSEYRCILLTGFTYSEIEVLAENLQAKVNNGTLPKTLLMLQMNE